VVGAVVVTLLIKLVVVEVELVVTDHQDMDLLLFKDVH
jgi:hypothetical protein